MQTVEIARNQWKDALDEFSHRHRDTLVSVDVLGSSLGALPEIRDLPLVGITAEPGAPETIQSRRHDRSTIIDSYDSDTDACLTARSDEGNDAALESIRGRMKTILRFYPTTVEDQQGDVSTSCQDGNAGPALAATACAVGLSVARREPDTLRPATGGWVASRKHACANSNNPRR